MQALITICLQIRKEVEMALREIRRQKMLGARRYSTAAMAAFLGVSRPTYERLEREPGLITRDRAEKLADYLDVPVDDIFLPLNGN